MPVWPSARVFSELARAAPVVPVALDMFADTLTPVVAFARLRSTAATCVLLESVIAGERWGRYSAVAVGHRAILRGRIEHDALAIDLEPAPGFTVPADLRRGVGLPAISRIGAAYRSAVHPDVPPRWGGLLGVWGHDVVRGVERLPLPSARGQPNLPALELALTDTTVVFDALTQRLHVITAAVPRDDGGVAAAYDAAIDRLGRVAEVLVQPGTEPSALRRVAPPPMGPDPDIEPAPPWTRAGYLDAVARAREHIAAGDVFQVVLSQAFDVPRDGLDPLDVYRLLRVDNPAPYMYLLQLPSATLTGASPEMLVRVQRDEGDVRRVTVRPIAGTRPRGATPQADAELCEELSHDAKERAEHLMLVDLGRNDVGRVAVGGSVRVPERFVVERYSRVMHLVSEVDGILRPELDALDAIAAVFPAGTLSGAPKVRALQIIDELEPEHRGFYGGAVGLVGFDGAADLAICIRSLVAFPDRLRVQAGAGLVFDSDPAREELECRHKASAVLRAIAMAKAGRP